MRFAKPASTVLFLFAIATVAAAAASPTMFDKAPIDKTSLLDLDRAVVTGGNGIYQVSVEDDASAGTCGQWTAVTGTLHPAGAGLNVLFGGGSPGTSNTILRSYTSGIDYSTGGACTALCATATPVVTPVLNGATTIGYRLEWSFADGAGPAIVFEQEVVVVGPVNGTETVANTVIRETHTVRNVGPASLSFGLRKQWDWQIGGDDGPYLGDCATPAQACDVSMNLTADGSLDGMYPGAYVINTDPAVTACPAGITPIGPNCGGLPPYLVAGTVTPPSVLSPPPSAPELLQFNSWSSLIGSCWEPTLTNDANCPAGDTAIAYFYGRTPGSAITLAAGEERSFTQYVVAAEDSCPDIIGLPTRPPGIPTLDRVGLAVLVLLLFLTAILLLRRRSLAKPGG